MKKFLIKFAITILILITYILISGFMISPYQFKTNEMSLNFAGIDEKWNGFKIVHISDIHYLKTVDNKMLNSIIEEINLINPDIIILSGDLLNNTISYSDANINELKDNLKKMEAKLGKYIVKGDNDIEEKWEDIISYSDFIDISDKYEYIFKDNNTPILISGSKDEKDFKIDTCFKIYVTHKPDDIDTVKYKEYDLILAGHSMGGINIPLIGRIGLPNGAQKYSYGKYNVDNSILIVSNGLGTDQTKFRFMNKPSINFYRIKK